jgi:TorA-specific chaperone
MLGGSDDLSSVIMDLAGSFSQLFLGAGGRHCAPPYQSAHQGDNARLFKEPVSEMNAILRQLDMSLPEDFREPSDHLSVQLNVMAHLVTSGTVVDQLDFLEDHLVKWVPVFAKACEVNDRKGFYSVAAASLEAWLEAEKNQLHICNQQSMAELAQG